MHETCFLYVDNKKHSLIVIVLSNGNYLNFIRNVNKMFKTVLRAIAAVTELRLTIAACLRYSDLA